MMDNQYQILKKENRLRAKCMSSESQAVYREAARYFRHNNRHPYDTELIYKELIGMGLAADAQGESLTKALGENPKKFYESLVESSRPNTIWSILSLWLLPFTFALYFVLELLIYFLMPTLSTNQLTLFSLTSMALGTLVIFLLTVWEKRRNVSNRNFLQMIYLLVFAATICLQMQLEKILPKITLISLPAWLGVLICAVLWYVSCRYRDRCYAKLAKERPWQG